MTAILLDPRPAAAPPCRAAPRLRRMRYEPGPGTLRPTPHSRPAPTSHRPAAGTDRLVVRTALTGVLRLAMEVLDGRRPPAQLARHFDDAPRRCWRVATDQRRTRTPARVLRVVVCLPGPDVAEASAVCEIDGRVRALATRFERAEPAAAWRCTALRLG